jgi:hypothetical protein
MLKKLIPAQIMGKKGGLSRNPLKLDPEQRVFYNRCVAILQKKTSSEVIFVRGHIKVKCFRDYFCC